MCMSLFSLNGIMKGEMNGTNATAPLRMELEKEQKSIYDSHKLSTLLDYRN
jgi:hypothetical protein